MKPYAPVSCTFVDYLEHFCIRKENVSIYYTTDDESNTAKRLTNGRIIDISGGRNGEFIHVELNGLMEVIRMDYLISVNDIHLSDFDSKKCTI